MKHSIAMWLRLGVNRKQADYCGYDYGTQHHDEQDIFCMWACTILPMPSSLNLQLLQVPIVCYGALPKFGQISIGLLISQHTEHFTGWSDVSMTWRLFSEGQNLVFCLYT
jgi:hypothetical protein